MRLSACIAALALTVIIAPPAPAYEPESGGVFSEKVIAITEPVPAPETVIDLEEGRATLTDYTGQVAVVVIWATWCEVCEIEMPIVDRLAGEFHGRGVTFLPISIDDTPAVALVAAHFEKHGFVNLPVMVDRHHGLANRVGVVGTPTTLVIDKFSQVVAAFEGQAPWGDPATLAYLEALAAAPDAAASRGLLAAPNQDRTGSY